MTMYQGQCWPNKQQMLLLKAALDDKEQASAAWEMWAAQVEIDKIDPFSYQMMPKIYANLSGTSFTHQMLLKGIYKRNWMVNQLLFTTFVNTLRAYSEPDCRLVLMKGAALLADFYRDWGVRVLGDIDVLVPQAYFKSLMQTLLDKKWVPTDPLATWSTLNTTREVTRHAYSFRYELSHPVLLVDVHTTSLVEISAAEQANRDWFKHAVPFQYGDVTLYRLSTTDLFLQVCVHGMQYSQVPLFRWILDAVTILRRDGEAIDWQDIIQQMHRYNIVLPMKQALNFLHTHFKPGIPASVLNEINALPISQFEKQDHRDKTKKVGRFLHIILALKCQAKRQNVSFLMFLKSFWGLAHRYEVPFYAVLKCYWFFKRAFLSRYERLF